MRGLPWARLLADTKDYAQSLYNHYYYLYRGINLRRFNGTRL
jgi:hypothetical protein